MMSYVQLLLWFLNIGDLLCECGIDICHVRSGRGKIGPGLRWRVTYPVSE